MTHEMSPEDREQFEENRRNLLEAALENYRIGSSIDPDTDKIILTGNLNALVNFYSDWRSEIEEML